MDLADVLIGNPDGDARTPTLRQGVVTQVAPLMVRVGSATTAQPCSAVVPAPVGAVVSVLVVDGDRIVLGPVATDWMNLTLLNGWAVFGGGFTGPQYRRVGDVVELRGLLDGTSASGGIGVLPVGFRPTGAEIFACWISDSGGTVVRATRVAVDAAGVIAMSFDSNVSLPCDHLSLEPIRFSVL